MRVDLSLEGKLHRAGQSISLVEIGDLLDGIAADRSVTGAAQRLGVSYRSAWGKLALLERTLGRPLVAKTKGHGTALTAVGTELREAISSVLVTHKVALAGEARLLERRLRLLLEDQTEKPALRLASSHDPLLLVAIAKVGGIDLAVVGSEEAASRLANGEADAACFHFGAIGQAPPPFGGLFRDRTLVTRPLLVREQGLMLAKGNPLDIQGVASLAARGARFVNRQLGSGTRLWFDRLLAEAGIAPEAIVGYRVEEFTHQAVAAMVAAGAADVGMGVRAVATAFALDFLPLGQETFWMAGPAAAVDDVRVAELAAALANAADTVPGYRLPHDVTSS